MYGLIGSFKAKPGQRDALISLMAGSTSDMPGCRSYVIARDLADPDLIWITEVWDSKENHANSLKIPEVRATIEKAMPLIGEFGMHVETDPVG
jgi:quinol monooxygenase YgiN